MCYGCRCGKLSSNGTFPIANKRNWHSIVIFLWTQHEMEEEKKSRWEMKKIHEITTKLDNNNSTEERRWCSEFYAKCRSMCCSCAIKRRNFSVQARKDCHRAINRLLMSRMCIVIKLHYAHECLKLGLMPCIVRNKCTQITLFPFVSLCIFMARNEGISRKKNEHQNVHTLRNM